MICDCSLYFLNQLLIVKLSEKKGNIKRQQVQWGSLLWHHLNIKTFFSDYELEKDAAFLTCLNVTFLYWENDCTLCAILHRAAECLEWRWRILSSSRVCHLPVRHGRSGQSRRVEPPSAHGSSRALHVTVQTPARRAEISEPPRLWTVRASDESSPDRCVANRGRAISSTGMPFCTFIPLK